MYTKGDLVEDYTEGRIMQELVEKFLDQNEIRSFEGRRGVEGLAKLVNAMGYADTINRYGQMRGGASLGDIFVFLEDNSGAIEALVEWIQTRRLTEWRDTLRAVVAPSDEDLVVNHFKDCPDCGHEIAPDAVRGEECDNCGHVFNWGPSDDNDEAWNNSDGQGG